MTEMRKFESGAIRESDADKTDFEGFLSPLVLERYGQYMHKHRKLADGSTRTGDNWKRGMPLDAYMKSAWRHFMAWWVAYRAEDKDKAVDIEESICALIFNASGFLHQRLAAQRMAAAPMGTREAAALGRIIRAAQLDQTIRDERDAIASKRREYVRCSACLGIYPEAPHGSGIPEYHACEPAPAAAERTGFDKPIIPREETKRT